MPQNEVTDLITDQEKLRRKEQRREQVLGRLWEIAALPPKPPAGSVTGQVKAIQSLSASLARWAFIDTNALPVKYSSGILHAHLANEPQLARESG